MACQSHSSIKQLTRSKNENYHIKHKRHTLRLLRKSLTQVLTELDGVQSADVQLEGKVNITFDENRVNIAQLIEVIEDAGFDATE